MPLSDRHLDYFMSLWRDYWRQQGVDLPAESAIQRFMAGGADGVPWKTRIPAGVEFANPETLERIHHIQAGMRKLERYHVKMACAVWLYYFLVGRDENGELIKNPDRAALLGITEPVYLNQVRRGKDFLMGFL